MKPNLYEVWGDTVDGRHLVYAIAIGAVVSLSAFFSAKYLLVGWVENLQMARAYAMLIGILGCLAGGVISAKLFKPKRNVVEHQADPAWRAQILVELHNEFGDLGKMSDLPPETIAELRELDLYDLFADADKNADRSAVLPETRTAVPVSSGNVNGGRS